LQLDLSGNQLCGVNEYGEGTYTAEGITAIADALRVHGGLTVANLLGNQLDVKSAKILAEVAKQKGISLCGIQRDQTTADFRKRLQPSDAILLASDLSQAVVTGTLTFVELGGNKLKNRGWGAIFAAICGNKDSKIMSLDASGENIDPAGLKLIAKALRTSVSGALTSLDLSKNALCGVSKGLIYGGTFSGTYTEEGITAIVEALRVNGGLTKMRYVSPPKSLACQHLCPSRAPSLLSKAAL
jgi:hypothetical protein